ncbi:MAG TPA: dihydroneopterin aldolase [Mycobacteriales bacterium]|nr:dihydroneopterin aldolase [Mycobacteriales bacterium]
MSDRIELLGLRVQGHHGVLAAEREQGQLFIVDAVLEVDTSAAARSDSLGDTVDYAALASRLAEVVAGEPVDLIETLAQRLADVCLTEAGVHAVEIAVHKPQAPVGRPVADVVVRIRRERTS